MEGIASTFSMQISGLTTYRVRFGGGFMEAVQQLALDLEFILQSRMSVQLLLIPMGDRDTSAF
jgi:hypothetical protein